MSPAKKSQPTLTPPSQLDLPPIDTGQVFEIVPVGPVSVFCLTPSTVIDTAVVDRSHRTTCQAPLSTRDVEKTPRCSLIPPLPRKTHDPSPLWISSFQ